MAERHDWLMEKHARAGESHYVCNSASHLGRVAMDVTLLACGLLFAKRTLRQSLFGVLKKL